jgi:hypothetical protein
MKCIENTPVRNSLMPKEGPGNAAAQKTIEVLKKEILMRDLIISSVSLNHKPRINGTRISGADQIAGPDSSGSPWMPDLTRAQKNRTVKEVSALYIVVSFLNERKLNSEIVFMCGI